MARRMPGPGCVTVSLRRSIGISGAIPPVRLLDSHLGILQNIVRRRRCVGRWLNTLSIAVRDNTLVVSRASHNRRLHPFTVFQCRLLGANSRRGIRHGFVDVDQRTASFHIRGNEFIGDVRLGTAMASFRVVPQFRRQNARMIFSGNGCNFRSRARSGPAVRSEAP